MDGYIVTVFKLLTLFMVLLNFDNVGVGGVNLSPSLQSHINQHGSAHVMLIMKHEIKHVVNSVNSRRFTDPNVKAATLVRELREFTRESQQNVLNFLGRRQPIGNVKPFWITNKISVRNATAQMIQELMLAHGDDILEIREAVEINLDDTLSESDADTPENIPPFPGKPEQAPAPMHENMHYSNPDHVSPPKPDHDPENTFETMSFPELKGAVSSWGIENINVAEAHKTGFKGEGIVVAIVDSGVRKSHEILKHNIRPTYNWFDAQNHTKTPFDIIGHGTHCTGTAVGWGGFGVAPGSQWVACRIFDKKGAREDIILTCAQWVTCPSLPDGTEEDCSKRPHVATNSWGGHHSDFFNDPILTWNAVNIVPVFAIGNSGPACKTAASPADHDFVISVGSSTAFNSASDFSSRGPSKHIGAAKQKPDLLAPGKRIMSASNKGNDKYVVYTGTSMAAPHVAGAVAVLLSKNPTATFQEIKDALQSTAFKSVSLKPNPNHDCLEGLQNVTGAWPNNIMGAGVLRVDESLKYI